MDLQAWIDKAKDKMRSLGVKQWGMLLLAGVCCLIIVFPMGDTEENTMNSEKKNTGVQMDESSRNGVEKEADYVAQLEERLSELLSSVEQVGRVRVMIMADSTVKKCVLQDGSHEAEQITETDSAGGSRHSVSERSDGTTVFYDIEGGSTPYILSETYPEITGVVVIAEGSGTGTVDLDIMNAVQVLFNLPAHKIRIMKMK